MEAIQLTLLALLVNGLMGSNTTANFSTIIVQRTSLVQNTTMPMSPTNANGLPNGNDNITSSLTNLMSSTTSQMITLSSKPSTSSLASQSTSNVMTINPSTKFLTTTPVMSKSIMRKQNNDDNLNASMIIACIIGGLLLLLVVCIIGILLMKRYLRTNTAQDISWAGTCPGPVGGEDTDHVAEDCDPNSAAVKRPSLTTFLTKKSKRDSLLDQYDMEVQEVQGINNLASTETEEETLPEVIKDNDKEKEPLVLTEAPSQEFPPPSETQPPLGEGDQQAPALATDAETSKSSQDVPETFSNNNDFPPPPMEFLDLVNDSDLPPPP
ncbi:uncharacterized protein LOC134336666 [Mobula hypostoma]|uniref:uncharacterized protein LOC134336666 n=1 Tax=Mobula hypostoma TaxID=723540 RepID=UPI002FC2B6FF